MEEILSNCTTKQVESIAENILFEIRKTDWSADLYFTGVSSQLQESHAILKNSIGKVLSSDYTEELSEKDDIFDQDIICFKKFVDANRYMRDDKKAKAADKIWEIITAHDQRLYRLSYEEQTSSATSLFAELKKPENEALVESLVGANKSLRLAEASNDDLMGTYRKSNEAKATKEDKIAASLQKKQVRNIINSQLLPYLDVMVKVNSDTYIGLYNSINKYIESVNTKARSQSTRNLTNNLVIEEQQ
ncbi:MAG: hypothetical protein JEZ01_05675 [Labilibaculum sp.]|nr:DUF6261 family protein [Labilibaculum sp.]MBI9057241.1 hypothetical protein [Labilibaculum sp.]